MSAPRRPGVVAVGDRVRVEGVMCTVIGLSGALVSFADSHGRVQTAPLAEMSTDRFELIDPGAPSSDAAERHRKEPCWCICATF